MNKVASAGFPAFITLTVLMFSASPTLADRADHLWPDPAPGGASARDGSGHDRAHRAQDKEKTRELVSRPFTSRHGSSPWCSQREVSTTDNLGNAVTVRRYLCD